MKNENRKSGVIIASKIQRQRNDADLSELGVGSPSVFWRGDRGRDSRVTAPCWKRVKMQSTSVRSEA